MSNLMVHTERFTRSRDPETSHEAGESITAEGWTALMERVYQIVYDAHRPVTAEQIVNAYEATRNQVGAPARAPQRIRGAIVALKDGVRVDFGAAKACTRALRVVDKEGRTAAGYRAERLEVVR